MQRPWRTQPSAHPRARTVRPLQAARPPRLLRPLRLHCDHCDRRRRRDRRCRPGGDADLRPGARRLSSRRVGGGRTRRQRVAGAGGARAGKLPRGDRLPAWLRRHSRPRPEDRRPARRGRLPGGAPGQLCAPRQAAELRSARQARRLSPRRPGVASCRGGPRAEGDRKAAGGGRHAGLPVRIQRGCDRCRDLPRRDAFRTRRRGLDVPRWLA